jgi:hypothetical protein
MENRKQYLEDDYELLDRLEEIVPKNPNGQGFEEALGNLQIKALLRTRKTYKDASDTQDRFNWVLLIFTMVQIGIAIFQFAYGIFPTDGLANKISIFILFLLFVVGIAWTGFRQIEQK